MLALHYKPAKFLRSTPIPKQYLAIKAKLIKDGQSPANAEKHAAMIYNAMGKGHVGKGSDKK
jgi:hypothetical protein